MQITRQADYAIRAIRDNTRRPPRHVCASATAITSKGFGSKECLVSTGKLDFGKTVARPWSERLRGMDHQSS